MSQSSPKPVSEMSFEEAMQALEKIVRELETGRVDLEKSIEIYERGAALKAHCEAKLKAAEERIEKITTSGGRASGTEPLDVG